MKPVNKKQSNYKVVDAYDRNKRKTYHRYEHNDGKICMHKKGLTYNVFYDRIYSSAEAREKYLTGIISAEETLKIVEVND